MRVLESMIKEIKGASSVVYLVFPVRYKKWNHDHTGRKGRFSDAIVLFVLITAFVPAAAAVPAAVWHYAAASLQGTVAPDAAAAMRLLRNKPCCETS
jgi:hypothetical protein